MTEPKAAYCTSVPAGALVVYLPQKPKSLDDVLWKRSLTEEEYAWVEFRSSTIGKDNKAVPGEVCGWYVVVRGYPHGFLFRWPEGEKSDGE